MTANIKNTPAVAAAKSTPAFRWGYVFFPVGALAVSAILAAVFFPMLPSEIAYHFTGDGAPDRWVGKSQFVLVMLSLQLFFTGVAAAVTWGMARMSVWLGLARQTGTRLERVIRLMGNMFAMPQVVLGYAMLDIFLADVFQVRLLPLWVFAVLVMGAGGVILGVFFVRAIRGALRPTQ